MEPKQNHKDASLQHNALNNTHSSHNAMLILQEEKDKAAAKGEKRERDQEGNNSAVTTSLLKKKTRHDSANSINIDYSTHAEGRPGEDPDPRCFDYEYHHQYHHHHALDLNFHPSVQNPVYYGLRHLWEPHMPIMDEKNNIQNDLHGGFTEEATQDRALDLELRIGVSSMEQPDLSLKL